MTNHVDASLLSALADGELSPEQLAFVQEHLERCPFCTSEALTHALLKNAVARAGQRYQASADVQDKMRRLITQEASQPTASGRKFDSAKVNKRTRLTAYSGWIAAAVLLLSLGGSVLIERAVRKPAVTLAENTVLETEIGDLHVAALAANQPLQVLSSDRHTVKPWFEGKIPFAFNLPDNLPDDTRLEGANLVFLHGAPVAQLVYAIGRHRASVFVEQRTASGDTSKLRDHAGFQVAGFSTAELSVIAMTDADRSRLVGLVAAFEQAQPRTAQ